MPMYKVTVQFMAEKEYTFPKIFAEDEYEAAEKAEEFVRDWNGVDPQSPYASVVDEF